MRLTGLTLPILLGALLLQVVTVVTKPGVCHLTLKPCLGKMKTDCRSDKTCCGTQSHMYKFSFSFKDPAVIKRLQCPVSSTPFKDCPTVIVMKDHNCTRDQNCSGTQNCCPQNCQYLCKNHKAPWTALCGCQDLDKTPLLSWEMSSDGAP